MFSDVIKSALEKEFVGQTRAVHSVVRGVTRLVSGLTPRERPMCAYMFMGPSGTGKTHLVRALGRIVHGDEDRVFAADCAQFSQGDPWLVLGAQLQPLFATARPGEWGTLAAPPLSIIRLDYLERAPQPMYLAIAAALETGYVTLPGGRRGSLGGCLLFLTSGLCAREILDEAPRIGFSGSPEEDQEGNERLYKLCLEKAESRFGADLIGRIDSLIVFHRLEEPQLADILERRLARVNDWLGQRCIRCELEACAKAFLFEHGRRDLRLGARDLVRAHQRYVEFPLADLLVSGRVPPGGRIRVERRPGEDRLHFTVTGAPDVAAPWRPAVREIPVA